MTFLLTSIQSKPQNGSNDCPTKRKNKYILLYLECPSAVLFSNSGKCSLTDGVQFMIYRNMNKLVCVGRYQTVVELVQFRVTLYYTKRDM